MKRALTLTQTERRLEHVWTHSDENKTTPIPPQQAKNKHKKEKTSYGTPFMKSMPPRCSRARRAVGAPREKEYPCTCMLPCNRKSPRMSTSLCKRVGSCPVEGNVARRSPSTKRISCWRDAVGTPKTQRIVCETGEFHQVPPRRDGAVDMDLDADTHRYYNMIDTPRHGSVNGRMQ